MLSRASMRTVAVVGLIGLGLSGVASASEPEDSFRDGLAALDQKNWTIAIASFRKAISVRAKEGGKPIRISARSTWYVDYLPHYYLGVALSQRGDLEGARQSWAVSIGQGAIQKTAMKEDLVRRLGDCGFSELEAALRGEPLPRRDAERTAKTSEAPEPQEVPEQMVAATGVAPSGGTPSPIEAGLGPPGPRFPAPTATPVVARALEEAITHEVPSRRSPSPSEPAATQQHRGERATPQPVRVAKVPSATAAPRSAPSTSGDTDFVRTVASLYFRGDYEGTRRAIRTGRGVADQSRSLCVLDAAAAYAQFHASVPASSDLEEEARNAVRRCHRLGASEEPSPRLFSPSFRAFWSLLGESTSAGR